MLRLLLASLIFILGANAHGRTGEHVRLRSAHERAHLASAAIRESLQPARSSRTIDALDRVSLGAKLGDYAAHPAGNPQRCESFTEAARRILAGGSAMKRTPDETIFTLDDLADKIFSDADAVETDARTSRTAIPERELAEVRASAHLARFHARRIVAAMHYNLFKRGLRLAELVAATYAEKEAVVAWRELTTLPAAPEIVGARRAELKKLEASLKDLEDQCCPPDEAILREKVWQPARPARAQSK